MKAMMATLQAPVELPTEKGSPVEGPGEKAWLPRSLEMKESEEKEITLSTHDHRFPVASPPKSPRLTSSQTHSDTRSSVAPETVELEAVPAPPPIPASPPIPTNVINFELPATRPTSRYYQQQHHTTVSVVDTVDSTDTETAENTSGSASTVATASTVEDAAVEANQDKSEAKPESDRKPELKLDLKSKQEPQSKPDAEHGHAPKSTLSSISAKRCTVAPPTSKFNRKPAPPLSSRMPSLHSLAEPTLAPSVGATPQHSRSHTPQLVPSPTPSSTEAVLQESRSATSLKKLRTLRPTPPSISLASQKSEHLIVTPTLPPAHTPASTIPTDLSLSPFTQNPTHSVTIRPPHPERRDSRAPPKIAPTETQEPLVPNIPQQESAKSMVGLAISAPPSTPPINSAPAAPTNSTPRKSIASSAAPPVTSSSPAPASIPPVPRTSVAALPDKVGRAQTPPGSLPKVRQSAKMPTPVAAKLPPSTVLKPSSGVASFMTATDTVIFRRFDEVHVQLLLCLQEEIAQLERELLKFDSARMTRADRDIERNKVLRELRKVVAEYDHLCSSWSQMQQNKTSKATTQSLKAWLERPGSGVGPTSKSELQWVEQSKDLSSVSTAQPSAGGFGSFMSGICGKRK